MQPVITPKGFDIFFPLSEGQRGVLRKLRCVRTCLLNTLLVRGVLIRSQAGVYAFDGWGPAIDYSNKICTHPLQSIRFVSQRTKSLVVILRLYRPEQTINRGWPSEMCLCLCVFSSHSFWTSMDVPAGLTQEEGNTGFSIHLLSAVLALIFLARRIQPFLSLVDRKVEFCVLTILIVLHALGIFIFIF